MILKFYQTTGLPSQKVSDLLDSFKELDPKIVALETELCYYVEITEKLNENDEMKLRWILGGDTLAKESKFKTEGVIEVGPRFNFSTPNSSNAVSICKSLQLTQIVRVEVARRYSIKYQGKFLCKIQTNGANYFHI